MIHRLADPIVQQTQPTPCSCTATCIAMALGIPVAELGVVLSNGLEFDDFGVWLAERGIWLRQGIRNNNRGESFFNGSLYLVGVRSLNIVNSDHAVLLDTRALATNANPRSGWKCFDPNTGRDGKAVYTWVDEHVTLDFCELRVRGGPYVTVGCEP